MSPTTLNGVRFINQEKYLVCYVDELSEDLKGVIRKHLSTICHGVSKATKGRKTYNYQNTVKSFLERYEKKTSKTKVGMVGELLTHIFILEFLTDFNTVSPFFNMEEKSIKKGFDILTYATNKNELWITEVKSGELRKGKCANETNKILLGKAKADLKDRLSVNESSLWENAINGATIALDNIKDTKDAVIDILDEIAEEITNKQANTSTKNVILVTSLFSNLNDEIRESDIKEFSHTSIKEKIFNNLIIFSIQKNTYKKVVDFLEEEAIK